MEQFDNKSFQQTAVHLPRLAVTILMLTGLLVFSVYNVWPAKATMVGTTGGVGLAAGGWGGPWERVVS